MRTKIGRRQQPTGKRKDNTYLSLSRSRFAYWSVALLFLISLPYTLSPTPLNASSPGTVAGQFLKTDISPRALGMGGSFVAVADGIYNVTYNPAGMGQLYLPEVSAMHLSGFSDTKTQFVAIGAPLPFLGLSGIGKPGIAFSALFESDGDFVFRSIDPNNGSIYTKKMEAEKNTVLSLSYGEKVFDEDVNIEGYNAAITQYMGLSVKYLKSRLLDTYSAASFLFDAGYLITETNIGLSLGASISNMGGKLKYVSKEESLPTILRLGASYFKPTLKDQTLLFSLEGDIYTNEKLKALKFGLEYHFQKVFNLRMGYKAMTENNGLTMGVGFFHEGIELDFGMSVSNDVFNTSQISLTYKFRNFKGYKPAKKREYYAPQKKRKPKKPRKKRVDPRKKKSKDSDFFWIY
ncbi:MAG: PorV/PorQ family protein [Elusimicrobiota bacterium]|nr:PorV/PorQ family protein [Elusimicrobiota bacterium]